MLSYSKPSGIHKPPGGGEGGGGEGKEGKKRRETGKERGNVSANVSVC